jgi:large subunit ribosomal protein L11
MAKESVEALVSGGKATAGPPIGPALGPLGVNIGKVVAEINVKTKDFAGMSVPVKITVDKDTKEFTITVGTPPTSQLVLKEAGVQKGSSNPKTDFVADLKIEQIIKISQMKKDALLGKDNKNRVREVLGTCQSMGILVEGKPVPETLKEVAAGKYDQEIAKGKTELTAEEMKELEAEKRKLQEELKGKREEFLKKAKEIVGGMVGKDKKDIRKALVEAHIPSEIINEVAPEDKEKK